MKLRELLPYRMSGAGTKRSPSTLGIRAGSQLVEEHSLIIAAVPSRTSASDFQVRAKKENLEVGALVIGNFFFSFLRERKRESSHLRGGRGGPRERERGNLKHA